MLETRIDAGKTALLLIDMQSDILKADVEPYSQVTGMVEAKGVIGNTARVLAAARKAGMPLIFTNHIHRRDNIDQVPTITDVMLQGEVAPPTKERLVEGIPGAQVIDELKPSPGEHVIWKRRSNAFYNSDLELMLRCQGIDTVILVGAVTDGCVVNTARGARERDLHVIVLSDCCACRGWEDDDYLMKNAFPKMGRVRTADEMIAAISEAVGSAITE
jgi:nicotinamidase-related amidase